MPPRHPNRDPVILVDGEGEEIDATNPLAVKITDGVDTLLVNSDGSINVVGGGGGTQYATNDAYQDADTGTLALTVRDDSLTTLTEADGDYSTLRVDSTGRLWVNVSNTVTVASHAVTNAGTFPVQVDGAALTALQLIDDIVHSGDAALSKYAVIGAVLDDVGTGTVTENQANTLRMSSRRALLVEGVASGTAQAVSVASGGIASGAVASGAVASGAFASGALASGSIAAGAIADMIVDDNAFTPASSRVIMAGFEADETGTDSVDEGDGGAGRMTLDRKQIVTLQPHTAGGLTTFMASGSDGSSILVATKQTIKASAGQLYGYYAYNPEAAVTFVHFYNTDTVTVGTTNPQVSFAIPPGSAANLAFPNGVSFSTAISCAATTTAGGNTAPATGVSLVAWYA